MFRYLIYHGGVKDDIDAPNFQMKAQRTEQQTVVGGWHPKIVSKDLTTPGDTIL